MTGCVTHGFAVNGEGSFESAPGVCVRCEVSQQRRQIEVICSHRGGEFHGGSQQLLQTGWIQ